MAEQSMFWSTNATGDGLVGGYTMAQTQAWMRALWLKDTTTEGILLGYANALAVTNPANYDLAINTGAAIVYGFFYTNTASVTKTPALPVVGTTGWRLVLRASWAAQTVRITLLESADGVAAAPAVTQVDTTTWDISLATGTITTGGVVAITDARAYVSPNIEVITGMLADASVTEAKIGGGAVTENKIGALAVTEGKLGALAVTEGKIGGGAVTANKIGALAVTEGKIAVDAVTTTKILDGNVTAAKIANRTRSFFVPALYAYDHTLNAEVPWGIIGATNTIGYAFPDTSYSIAYGFFDIPQDYASAMTVKALVVGSAGGAGNIRMAFDAYSGADGESHLTHTDVTAWANVAGPAAGIINTYVSTALASAVAGDHVRVFFSRDGTNVGDTYGQILYVRGFVVSYTADS